MKVVIQRSKESSVIVDNKCVSKIAKGLVVLACFTEGDTESDMDYIIKKLLTLRIFDDENGVMNRSIEDTGGSILLVSQFTLYADTKKGARPSYIKSMKHDEAKIMFDKFTKKLSSHIPTYTGVFGADMTLNITNDGPVTIIIDTENK